MNRIVAIARLLALGRCDALLWPVAILAIAFSVNLVTFASIADKVPDNTVTGGLGSIYIATLAFAAVAVTQHFPFALGLSVTRREFTAGLGLFLLVQTIAYSLLLVLMQWIEQLTGGWGVHMRFFGLGFFGEHSVPVQFVMYAVPMLLMTLLGTAAGALFVRWNRNGILTATVVLMVLLGTAAALVSRYERWPAIGHWLTHTSPVVLFAAWPLVVVVALATGSWFALRRATP